MSNPNQYATGWHKCTRCGCLLPPSVVGETCTDPAWCELAKKDRLKVEKAFAYARKSLVKAGRK